MKKSLCCIMSLFMLLVSVFAFFAPLPAVEAVPAETGTFRLPASLKIIGEDAFEGTAAESLILESEVATVESRAFAGMAELREVYIPAGVEALAEDAFAGAESLTVYGTEGSLAEDWAARMGYRFVLRDIWSKALLPAVAGLLAVLLCLSAFLPRIPGGVEKLKLRTAALSADHLAIPYKKRADLFALDLCFP